MLSEFFILPQELTILFVFVFGAIIGSFLNVVIYRLHTGKSLNGSSHCLSCGNRLAWYDLFPVLSYIFLRGRCRNCGCRFTSRYVFVEIMTGALFVFASLHAASISELFVLFAVLSILVIIFVYDMRHYIIPDVLTLLLLCFCSLLFAQQHYGFTGMNWQSAGVSFLAAALGALFLFALWFISKGKWIGFGDVKLAFPLGLLVGGDFVFSFIVGSFWIGAGVSIFLVLLAHIGGGKLRLPFLTSDLTIKSVVPFAPFLIAASLLVYFTKINVLTLFTTFS